MKLHYQPQTFRMMTTNSLKKNMNSTYDLVEEDFIHRTSLSTSNIQDDDNNFLKKTMTSTYDLVEED
jgi:hypothetical protein